jgi:nitrite reductase/ring-hydroxylating ferredoxin subunit
VSGESAAARLADVPPGALHAVTLADGTAVCLANVGGEICAFADECPHAAFPMSAGEVLADGTVMCAWHGARFDARTGAVVAGPAAEPLAVYPARVDGDAIFVDGNPSGR